jgi:hypothetical protein
MPIVWSLSILVGFFSVFSTLRSLTGLTAACASDSRSAECLQFDYEVLLAKSPGRLCRVFRCGPRQFILTVDGTSAGAARVCPSASLRLEAPRPPPLLPLASQPVPRPCLWLPQPRPAWLRATPGSASSCFEVSSRQTSGRRSRPGQLLVGSRRLTYLPLKKSCAANDHNNHVYCSASPRP